MNEDEMMSELAAQDEAEREAPVTAASTAMTTSDNSPMRDSILSEALEQVRNAVLTARALNPSDTELLDWLARQSPKPVSWIARSSSKGRGFRLYATNNPSGSNTPREALLAAYERSLEAGQATQSDFYKGDDR